MPDKLKNSKKALINIKSNGNACFLWSHSRHLNLSKIHPQRITKVNTKTVNDLDYVDVKYPVSKKDYSRIKQKNNICINVFIYENDLV